MKSKSLEMILDNMYFIASVDEKEEKVFVALDFEEAGRRYAELKSEGDAIIWHLKKKDLVSRVDCDLRTPMEMVSEERLLRLMSLVVVEGKDSPSLRPTVGSRDTDKEEIVSEENSEAIAQSDWDIEMAEDDKEIQEIIETKSWERFKSHIKVLVRRYNINVEDIAKDINKFAFNSWFRNLPLNIRMNIAINSIVLGEEEDIEITVALYLVKLQIQSGDLMDDILREFRETIKKSEYKDIESKFHRENREKRAARAVRAKIWERKQKRKSSKEELPESTEREKDLKHPPKETIDEEDIKTTRSVETAKPDHLDTDDTDDTDETSEIIGELDQRSTSRNLVDGWKEREEEPVSIPKVESSHEVKKPKPIPSSRVLLRGFLSYCKKRGSSKKLIQRRIPHVKTFLKFIKTNGRSILEIDEEGVKEFESFLRDVRGFKTKTVGNYSTSVRIFYDYTNSEEITNIDISRPRAWSVARMMEIVGKPLTRVYDDESNTIYEEVNQRILEGIEKLGIRAKQIDLVRFVLNVPKSDEVPDGSKVFIRVHVHYLVEHNILEKSLRGRYKMVSKSISEPMFHKVGETMGVVSSEELMDGYGQWLKRKGFEKIHSRSEHHYVSIAREFIGYINDIGKTILDDNRKHMIELHKSHLQERGLKESTIKVYIGGIRVFYNYIDENLPEELSDQNESAERETQPLFNDFNQWLERKHYKKITRTVGIVRGFKNYIESTERTILDDDRGRMIDLYRLHLQGNKYEKSTIGTYVSTIHLFYRFVDETDGHHEKAGEVSILPDDSKKEKRQIISYKQLIGGFRSWLKKKGFISINKGGYGHGYIGCVEDYIKYVDKRSSLMDDREERIEAHKSHLQDKGLKYGSISYSISAINAFYRFVEEDIVNMGIKDVSEPISHGVEMVSEAIDDVSQYPKSIEGWVKRAVEGDHLTVVCKIDISKKPSKPWLISIYEELNQTILRKIEEMGGRTKRVDLMRSILGIFKPNPVPSTPIVILRVHLKYLLEHGFLKRPKKGIYVLPSNGEKLTDQYPRTHEGWARRAVGKDGDLSRIHIDMSNESFEPNYRYIYKRVVEKIIDRIGRVWKRDLYSPLIVGNETWEAYMRKGDVVREVLNIPEGNEIPSGASFFIQVHLKFMVEHDYVERVKGGVYVVSGSVYQKGTIQKWNQIPREEKSPPKALKSVARIDSETIDGHEHGHQKTERDWVREILGDDLQKVDIEDLKDGDGKRKSWRSPYTGINQRILLELENGISVSRLELTRLLFDFKGRTPVAVINIMDAHLSYLVDQGYISRIQRGIYRLVDDDKKALSGISGLCEDVMKKMNEKVSASTTKDEKTSHRELSAEDWIRRITKGEKPYAWISYGSMDDTRVVQRGQGAPIYPEMNRRIMVEVRASKDPVKRNELIRPVFDLGWDERISQTVNTILNNHLRYLLYRNVLKQPAKGYYESVPDDPPDYRMDPIFERKIHEGVMDRMTKK